jgi:7,8-dihydroneopterin aldolase/epimerase/oxygenase
MSDGDLGAGRARDGRGGLRRLLLRDLMLLCEIGGLRHQRGRRQRIRVNLELAVREDAADGDAGASVACGQIAAGIRRLANAGRVNLAETLAERIALLCLADSRIRVARVQVEKLDADPDAAGIGIEIERINPIP